MLLARNVFSRVQCPLATCAPLSNRASRPTRRRQRCPCRRLLGSPALAPFFPPCPLPFIAAACLAHGTRLRSRPLIGASLAWQRYCCYWRGRRRAAARRAAGAGRSEAGRRGFQTFDGWPRRAPSSRGTRPRDRRARHVQVSSFVRPLAPRRRRRRRGALGGRSRQR